MATYSLQWLGLTLDTTAKSLVLASIAFLAIRALRVRNSHVRHRIWAGVLAGMLVIPALSEVVPEMRLPLPVLAHWQLSSPSASPGPEIAAEQGDITPPRTSEDALVPAGPAFDPRANPHGGERPEFGFGSRGATLESDDILEPASAPASIKTTEAFPSASVAPADSSAASNLLEVVRQALPWLGGLWFVVAAGLLTRLAFGWRAATRLRQASLPITLADLHELGVSPDCWPSTVHSGELLECSRIRVPLTLGLVRPVVLLPPEWLEWSTEKLQSVLLHERTHLERGDTRIAFLAEVNVALNWFNPLAWWLRQHLSTLAEEACDDAAISSVGDRARYARHLLEVAAAISAAPGRVVPVGVSMARQSNVESRINAILDFTRPLSKRPAWTTTLAILLLAGPVIGLAAAIRPSSTAGAISGENPSTTAIRLMDASTEPTADAKNLTREPSADAETSSGLQDEFRYAGTVVDDNGQPVEGASVTLTYWRARSGDAEPGTAMTDAKGQFEIKRRRSNFNDGQEEKPWKNAQVIASKSGYGFAAALAAPFEVTGIVDGDLPDDEREFVRRVGEKERVLKLGPDLTIRGKIVDTEGRPIAGALIEPIHTDEGINDTLDAWEEATKERDANYYSARVHLRRNYGAEVVNGPVDRTFAPARTDTDGAFTLAGMGRERIVSAVLSGPNIESVVIRIRTRSGEPIKLSMSELTPERFYTFYPADFTHVAGPSQPVQGIVTDLKTGKPLAGVFVRGEATATERVSGRAGFIRSTTDQEGRFRLEGFPPGKNRLVVLPSVESGYLTAGTEIDSTAGPEPLVINISLTPGIRARGTVKEAGSEKPLRGYVEYFALTGNPALQETRNFHGFDQRLYHPTDHDGNFELPVLPGPGVITFRANDTETYGPGEGYDKIVPPNAKSKSPASVTFSAEPQFLMSVNYHRLIPIEPTVDSKSIDVSLTLTRLQSFQGKVLAADGSVVDKFLLNGDRAPGNWHEHKSPDFTVRRYQPQFGRRLMAYDPRSDQVGLLDVTGDAPSSVEIRLQPAARVLGRIVDDDGQPMADARIFNYGRFFTIDYARGKYDPERAEFVDIQERPLVTGADGRFELLGVLPGLKYGGNASLEPGTGSRKASVVHGPIFTDLVVKPGEKHDLGDVKITKPRPMEQTEANAAPSPANAEATRASTDVFRYAGTVLDEKGQPVEGAGITLNYWRFTKGVGESAIAVTDRDGRFEFSRRMSDFGDSQEERPWTYAQIVATKAGHGFTAASSVLFETSGQILRSLTDEGRAALKRNPAGKDRVLKLGPDAPIRGRIIDTEGRPVVGALLEPFSASEGIEGSLDAWEVSARQVGANYYGARKELRSLYGGDLVGRYIDRTLPPVKTDADGKFTLSGVGRERIINAVLSGPNIESSVLHLRSRAGETLKLSDDDRNTGRFFTYYPNDFTHVAGPSQPVEGVVTDLKTGKPVEGAYVYGERTATYIVGGNARFIHATTDAEGRYRLEGFPLGANEFVILPTVKSGYLPAGAQVTTSIASEPHVKNIPLTPAVRARGIVKELGSGQPVRGYVEYWAFSNNPALTETRNLHGIDMRYTYATDDQGRFEIPVLPGPGLITFSATAKDYGRGTGADNIQGPTADSGSSGVRLYATVPYFVSPTNYNGLIPIDPAVGEESIETSLTLTPLQTFPGRVVDEQGRPVDRYVLFGERAPGTWYEHKSASFDVRGYQSAYGRRVIAYDPKADQIGRADVVGKAPESIEIHLKPAARIKGRLLDGDGQPLAGARIDNDRGFRKQPVPLTIEEIWGGKFDPERAEFVSVHGRPAQTDAAGRFEIVGIIPGLKYTARVTGTRKVGNDTQYSDLGAIFIDAVASPGETLDLGDVKPIARNAESPRSRESDPTKKEMNASATSPQPADGTKQGAIP